MKLKKMGEAKRRREQGFPPKAIKQEKKYNVSPNILQNLRENQILPYILALGFVVFLIIDLFRYYNQ